MPKVQDAEPTAPYALIDLDAIYEWKSLPGGKLIAIPFGIEARKQSRHDSIRRRIFEAVAEITQSQELGVSAPEPNDRARETRDTPTTFLIYNLTDSQRQTVLQQIVWSSLDITFRVAPALSLPNFLFTIAGLSTMSTGLVQNMVQKVWQDDKSQESFQTITQPRNAQEREDNQLILKDLIATMKIERLDIRKKGNILTPKFNVYAESARISSDIIWSDVRHFLANRSYDTSMLGRATIQVTPYDCAICHSADHPRGLCTFPKVPGWNGPTWRSETQRNWSEQRVRGREYPRDRREGRL